MATSASMTKEDLTTLVASLLRDDALHALETYEGRWELDVVDGREYKRRLTDAEELERRREFEKLAAEHREAMWEHTVDETVAFLRAEYLADIDTKVRELAQYTTKDLQRWAMRQLERGASEDGKLLVYLTLSEDSAWRLAHIEPKASEEDYLREERYPDELERALEYSGPSSNDLDPRGFHRPTSVGRKATSGPRPTTRKEFVVEVKGREFRNVNGTWFLNNLMVPTMFQQWVWNQARRAPRAA